MTETCSECGKVYLPKPGTTGCPHCNEARSEDPASDLDESWGDIDGGWDEDEDEDETETETEAETETETEAEAEAEAEAGTGNEANFVTGKIQRPKRTRAKRKKRPTRAEKAPAAKTAKKKQHLPKSSAEQAESASASQPRERPAWLLPVIAALVAVGVFVLYLIARR